MLNIGIDAISFYTSHYYLELATFAQARQQDVNKYHHGLGQYKMSIAPPCEDIVTLGANAAAQLLTSVDKAAIDTVLFATESGIDQSKAAGIYVHRLLELPPHCSVIELKQACYSATAALQMAIGLIHQKPARKVLIIAADISRYGFQTTGESSQGCGAVAMLIAANPRLLAITAARGLYTEDVMDFWRPNYQHEAIVDGKFSMDMYMRGLEQTWRQYQVESGLGFEDHAFYCYHTPVPRLVEKAHYHLAKLNDITLEASQVNQQIEPSLAYSRQIGNSYAASLYVGFASLLDQLTEEQSGQRIGFYSYGSGCVAEYFSGILQPGYEKILQTKFHQALLSARESINFSLYEQWYAFLLPEDGSHLLLPEYHTGQFRLKGIEAHKRIYERLT